MLDKLKIYYSWIDEHILRHPFWGKILITVILGLAGIIVYQFNIFLNKKIPVPFWLLIILSLPILYLIYEKITLLKSKKIKAATDNHDDDDAIKFTDIQKDLLIALGKTHPNKAYVEDVQDTMELTSLATSQLIKSLRDLDLIHHIPSGYAYSNTGEYIYLSDKGEKIAMELINNATNTN